MSPFTELIIVVCQHPQKTCLTIFLKELPCLVNSTSFLSFAAILTQLSFKNAMQFAPYVKPHMHPLLSIDEVAEVMKSLMG